MSRTTISRVLGSSSRATTHITPALQLSKRTLIGDLKPEERNSSISVDPRVLDGLPGFIPKSNVDRVCDWQAGLWTRLQAEVRNNPGLLEIKQKWDRTGLDMTYLLSQSSRDPSMTVAFNYASLLLNNSYFLEGLNGDPQPQEVPAHYKDLEEKVQAYAEGMVGGGWLWIVRYDENRSPADVFPSFAAGTLLVTNRSQRGRQDIPIFGTPDSSGVNPKMELGGESSSSEQTPSSEPNMSPRLPPTQHHKVLRSTTDRPVPVAVLNLFEHAYVGEKYGVWNKADYARDWFRSLNWNTVQKRASIMG